MTVIQCISSQCSGQDTRAAAERPSPRPGDANGPPRITMPSVPLAPTAALVPAHRAAGRLSWAGRGRAATDPCSPGTGAQSKHAARVEALSELRRVLPDQHKLLPLIDLEYYAKLESTGEAFFLYYYFSRLGFELIRFCAETEDASPLRGLVWRLANKAPFCRYIPCVQDYPGWCGRPFGDKTNTDLPTCMPRRPAAFLAAEAALPAAHVLTPYYDGTLSFVRQFQRQLGKVAALLFRTDPLLPCSTLRARAT